MLSVGKRRLWLPPFGSGWFDIVFMDTRLGLRITRDSRGDTSVFFRMSDLRIDEYGDAHFYNRVSRECWGAGQAARDAHQAAACATCLCQCARATCKRSTLTCFWKAATDNFAC